MEDAALEDAVAEADPDQVRAEAAALELVFLEAVARPEGLALAVPVVLARLPVGLRLLERRVGELDVRIVTLTGGKSDEWGRSHERIRTWVAVFYRGARI